MGSTTRAFRQDIPLAVTLRLLDMVAPRLHAHATLCNCAFWSNAQALVTHGSLSFKSSGTFSGGSLDAGIRVLATAAYQQEPTMLSVSPAQFGQEYL